MQDLALTLMVVVIMAGVGLELRPADLRAGLERRGAVAGATLVNLVLVPLLTLAAARLAGLDQGFTLGLLLCAASPGAPAGPMFARLVGGALGFATALMVLLGVVALVTAPLTLALATGAGADRALLGAMSGTLATVQLLPLALGIALRARRPDLADRLARPTRIAGNLMLLLVVVGMLIARGDALLRVPPALHALIIAGEALVLLPPALLPRGKGLLRGAAMVTAARNVSLALLLSGRFFEDPHTDLAVLVCGFWMITLPGAVGAWGGRR